MINSLELGKKVIKDQIPLIPKNPGVYKMFRALAEEKINILAISTSEIKISVIIDERSTVKAVKKLHNIFKLD